MTDSKTWKIFGNYLKDGRISVLASAIAVLFAAQTFINPQGKYEDFMIVLAMASAAWAVVQAIKTKAIFGFIAVPLALVWLNPALGGDWFNSVSIIFFFAHAVYAMVFAVFAYTFMRLNAKQPERKPRG
jgi:hypothetical protein